MRLTYIYVIILLLFGLCFAEKTDVVILHNGDQITGEVKNLDFGLLELKTDYMGTLKIEWIEIFSVKALNQYFRLEREDGRLLYGSLDSDTLNNKILVVLDTTRVPVNFEEIIRITPIKETVWDRIDLNIDLGYSYTKASTVSELTFSGKVSYRAYRNSVELLWSSTDTEQQDKPKTVDRTLNLNGKRLFRNRWYFNSGLGGQQNTELGIDLRLSWKGGIGRYIIQSQHSLFQGSMGGQLNREYGQNSQNANNLEGVFTLEFYRFIYQTPKMSLDTYLHLFPGLTEWGRIRTELNIKLNWEIIADLYWVLTLWSKTDNKPPSGENSKIDYALVVSFGWKL
ncbi:MAG: DUF481 domain-containing protein [bacterium]|nr:MAG: DUF481 domain-containing protein [bacterium]